MKENKVQEELKRVEEVKSMKLEQLSDMDCNLEITKTCDGCDLWYMKYDTELHKMRWHYVKAEVGTFLLRRATRAIQKIRKIQQDEKEKTN